MENLANAGREMERERDGKRDGERERGGDRGNCRICAVIARPRNRIRNIGIPVWEKGRRWERGRDWENMRMI